MLSKLERRDFEWLNKQLSFFVPEQAHVRELYLQDKSLPFPYWARLWPSAIAMARFLVEHPHHVQNKKVLELAAGLGLPSLLAAGYAGEVCCSDYLPEPLQVVQQSASLNGLKNIHCKILDWHHLPQTLSADTLLLSDVNYDPAVFGTLYAILQRFLSAGTLVIVSTPQRLMAKDFIERLLPYCKSKTDMIIADGEADTVISVFVLSATQV